MTPAVDFIRPVLKRLDDMLESTCEGVLNGVPHERYAEQVGYIRGLRHARELIVARLGDDKELLNHR